MQEKQRRALRRHHRVRVIEHAFRIYWYNWSYCDDIYKHRGWWGYERTYLNSEQEKRQVQDDHRAETRKYAVQRADYMAFCSCQICRGWKEWAKDSRPCVVRERLRDEDDFLELLNP